MFELSEIEKEIYLGLLQAASNILEDVHEQIQASKLLIRQWADNNKKDLLPFLFLNLQNNIVSISNKLQKRLRVELLLIKEGNITSLSQVGILMNLDKKMKNLLSMIKEALMHFQGKVLIHPFYNTYFSAKTNPEKFIFKSHFLEMVQSVNDDFTT